MKNLGVSTLLGIWLAATGHAVGSPCSPSSVPPLSNRELSQNGALVKSGNLTGMGFVVGWKEGEAWIAAPAHVVYGDDPTPEHPEAFRAGLEIRLFGDNAPRRLCDESPGPRQGAADLVFLCVEWAGRPFFSQGVLARRIVVGEELALIDIGTGQQFHGSITKAPESGSSGKVVTPGSEGDVEVLGAATKGLAFGVVGQSGALTASARGVIGLYLAKGTQGRYHILSMPAIRSIAEVALVPWQLGYAEYFDCTATRKVCLSAETSVKPAGVSMRSIFSPGTYDLRSGSCQTLPEGRYEIVVPPLGPSCEPKVLAVYSEPEDLQLALRCSVALMGTWRTEDGDELGCVEIQLGRAQCSGLIKQGFGRFDGTINAMGQGYSIFGSFYDPAGNPREASGKLAWSGERLEGEIRRQQEIPKPLKLRRVVDQ